MSQYNLNELNDLDTYGEHLFSLDHKWISFSTDQPQENKKGLETKVTSSDKSSNKSTHQICQSISVSKDQHFQMSFINEHELILKKYIKNYMELLTNKQDGLQNCITQPQQIEDHHDNLERTFKIVQETSSHFNLGEILRISNEILKNQKLASFLRMIHFQYHSRIAITLVKITCQFWQEYSKRNYEKLMDREIIEQTNRMLTSAFLKKVNKLLPRTLKKDQVSKLKTFLNVFTNTILFIANQYFVNPYYQLEEQLMLEQFQNYELYLYDSNVFQEESDEDDQDIQVHIKGRKMIKRETSL